MIRADASSRQPLGGGAASGWRGSARRAAIVSLLLIAALDGWSRLQQPRASLHGTPLPSRPAPAFKGLSDTHGRPFDWKAERGRAVLVFFGYTHCPDVCPLTLSALARALDRLGPLRSEVRVVFVSLDPARDTPGVLRAYLDAFMPGVIGLRGPLPEVARAARQWGVTWRRVDTSDGGYWIDHTAAVTLVGPRGRLRARYGYGQLTDPAWLPADLRAVLAHP
ncbi:SCO family protein [Thiomonas sp.]|uniref:SCO family protein n=1 Tax=Thiomonas sp. TaxID=2047785 RepID=UPI0025894B87|nr:SCO family protein [Thiomonas sp.]